MKGEPSFSGCTCKNIEGKALMEVDGIGLSILLESVTCRYKKV